MNRLNIVVINFKTPEMTTRCVESLLSEIDYRCDRVIIVDNNSNDGSVDVINCWITNQGLENIVHLVSSDINGGFSYGCNLGAKSDESEYLIFLNSDALVTQNSISKMLYLMQSNKKIGIVSPLIVNKNGIPEVSRFYNKTPVNEFLKSAGTGLFTKLFNYFGIYAVAQCQDNNHQALEWVSFACVLLRRETYNNVGPLDEGYFMYSEDNDYCRRLKSAGWDIVITNEAKIIHLNKGLSSVEGRRMPSFFYASRTRYFMKHYGYIGLLMANCFFTLGLFVRWARFLIGRGVMFKYKYAFFDIWTNFFNPLKRPNQLVEPRS